MAPYTGGAAMAALSRGVLGKMADQKYRDSKTDKDRRPGSRRPGSRRPGSRRPRKARYPGFMELPPIHIGPPGSGPLPKRTGGGTGRRTGRQNQTNRNNRREALNRILSIAAAQARAGGG